MFLINAKAIVLNKKKKKKSSAYLISIVFEKINLAISIELQHE